MTAVASNGERGGASSRSMDFYRAVWRWHFYAGLLVLPFLILLSLTGGAYLFRDEVDRFVHADLKVVEPVEAETLAPGELVEAALAANPGTAVRFMPPANEASSAEVTVRGEGSARTDVYVNPYDGEVLGTLPYRGTIMWTVRNLHSLAMFGTVANAAIEIAGGLSILLVATGVYLWWPRGQRGGVVSLRGSPRRRVFWRDLHAVSGIAVGAFIVFLAVTGMPWSVFWGAETNRLAGEAGLGYPPELWDAVPTSTVPSSQAMSQTSWTLESAPMPVSEANGAAEPIGLDRAVHRFDGLGLARGYAVDLPISAEGVYSASVFPDDLSAQRVVHLDQYSGEPLIDVGVADYGAFARAMEWGINVHMGQEYGAPNQAVLAIACLAIAAMSVSAGVMWWKRRPSGSLGVPPMPSDRRLLSGMFAILMVGGIVYPLAGATLLVLLALDMLLFRRGKAAAI